MTVPGPLSRAVSGSPAAPAHVNRNTARRVVPLFRPYRAQVAAVVGLIVVTSTIGIINPLLIQAVFNKALFVPGGPNLQLLVILVAGLLLAHGTAISAGTVVAFTTLQTRLYFPIGQLLQVSVELRSSLALFDRIFEYLDVVPDIVDAHDAADLPVISSGGRVALREVCFRYPGAPVDALAGVSLEAGPSQLVALVGPSGAGKTTISYLIPRPPAIEAPPRQDCDLSGPAWALKPAMSTSTSTALGGQRRSAGAGKTILEPRPAGLRAEMGRSRRALNNSPRMPGGTTGSAASPGPSSVRRYPPIWAGWRAAVSGCWLDPMDRYVAMVAPAA